LSIFLRFLKKYLIKKYS